MRGLRSTIALLAVLIGLSAYIYFVTSNQPEGAAEEVRERVFAGLDSEAISEVTIKSDAGDTTTIRKNDGQWLMAAPLAVKADTAEAAAISSNLASLDVTRVVEENPTDLKDYGLDPPLVEIAFKAAADKGGEHRLFLGSKSPTGGDVFARRDTDKRVILVAGYLEPIFNRSTFNLRDKTLLALDREKIDRITVSAGARMLELAREGSDWKMVKPSSALADAVAVDALIGRLLSAQMKSIVTEQPTPADLIKHGFSRPQATATLAGGGATTSLIFGATATEMEVYVREPSRGLIATADNTLLTDFQKEADEYRRKDLFASRAFLTDRVEFTRDGQSIVFEKVRTPGQPDKWRRLSPTVGDPETMAVEDLLSRLQGLRATAFVDAAVRSGLDRPSLAVSVRFEEGKREERVTFARSEGDVYAAIGGQPGAVTVEPASYDEVIKALDLVAK